MFVLIIFCIVAWFVYKSKQKKKYKELEDMVFADLGISGWLAVPFIDVVSELQCIVLSYLHLHDQPYT